ncbi:MAG: NUDIX hydrolase [Calditrichaeota bacterium]|nr:MAG: NUDIX hydrolase [Calditrichota bacterium]MBL1203889.1 NUDIX hydrolase [Calditrichota bacterium]NOG43721.1 NUDIX hydrolase [Calditrichota bacterium]
MKNPWKKISTKEIYKNDWIRLREDKVINPSGNNGIYSVVEAKPAIGIVPITHDLQTYLVGQFRYPLGEYSWEIPEGGGLHGEDTLIGAKRELREETGLTAKRWTFLNTLYTSNCFTDEVGYVYLAEDLEQGESDPDDTEDLIIKKLPFEEAWQMVLNTEIKDALAVIGLMRAYNYLRKNNRINF